ncbi:MAG: TonB-dependent receptor [Candidatus Marinimicrobia bacterium]|nr:TonB-dependent receptor [Candidatus Neomarinimicrobiota bacterium]
MKNQKNNFNTNLTKGSLFTVFTKLIIAFCIMVSFLFADNYFVNGSVKNKITNKQIVGVNVQVDGDSIGTATNKFGYFRLEVEKLPVKLKISHIGYKNKTIVVKKTKNLILLKPSVLTSEEILVTATKAIEGKTPVAFTLLNKSDIDRKHSHQDLPILLSDTPGTFSYSDAGNGVGYSYLKIRGFSQNRISIMLNGIPLNDPEAYSVYWVDHGDIASSVSNIQIQRGVANSLYGSAAFGGSVNLTTNYNKMEEAFTSTFGYGNYCDKDMLDLPSKKYSFHFVEKPENIKNLVVFGRYSNLLSNGYRKGSGVEQESFQFAMEKNSEKSRTQFEIIHGSEETMFSWDGVIPYYGYNLNDRNDRRYNYYADPEYNGGFNDANKDVFTQSIISLQHNHKIKNNGLLNITLYKVSGDGYYEQFKGDRSVTEYNLTDIVQDTSLQEVDLIRRKWLKNGYYGAVYHYSHNLNFGQITIGGDYRNYSADHFGKVLQAENVNFISDTHRYYSDESKKISFSFYIHSIIEITDNLLTMVDLKYLGHRYEFDQEVIGAFTNGYEYKLKYDFFDPHFGIRYNFSNNLSIFGNISTAHREPSDSDIYDHDEPDMEPAVSSMDNEYVTSKVKEEFLIDSEFGVQYNKKDVSASLNLFRMQFSNELVPIEYRYNEGSTEALHGNADKSIHQGLEFSFISKFGEHLKLNGNFSYSDNYFVEYFGDSLGWSGWGGIADYSNKTMPAYPKIQYNGKITYKYKTTEIWFDYSHVGKQYIDFNNTESASINKYNLFNIGTRVEFQNILGFETIIDLRINNLFDTLYETFGYNYYSDKNTRVDVYWPAAVRNYYLTIKINI